MRDGKKLAVDVYLVPGGQPHPAILVQTPYNRTLYRWFGLPLGVRFNLSQSPFHFIFADWRGFYGSSGAATPGYDRGLDGYDLTEWIKAQPWSDGQVGTHGASALGAIQYQTARHQPPALKCMAPLVTDPRQLYRNYYPGGVYRQEFVEFLDELNFGVGPFVRANPVFNNAWNFTQNQNFYPAQISVPVFSIAGWYDHNIADQTEYFEFLRTLTPPAVRERHKLLVGPWTHGGFSGSGPGGIHQGELSYPDAVGAHDSLAMQFFRRHLLNENNGWDERPTITYYHLGRERWEYAVAWPATTPDTLFLSSNGRLTSLPDAAGTAVFPVDGRNPSPTIGGPVMKEGLLQGPYDQAQVESRNDVAVFSTPPLTDTLTLSGGVKVRLRVSTSASDGDFMIRLTDVYPDGRSIILAHGTRRLRFRNGYTAAETSAVAPFQTYTLEIPDLPPLYYSFLPGHRIRLVVSGNNFPAFQVNLHNGNANATAGDTLAAQHTVHFAGSWMTLPTVPQNVWPSDANADRVCDANDLFLTAAGYGQSGPARAVQSTLWAGYPAPLWPARIRFQDRFVNTRHLDANGDGVVNLMDVAAAIVNRGRSR